MPDALFEKRLEPKCLHVSTNRELIGEARVCFPNPKRESNPVGFFSCVPASASSGTCPVLLEEKCCTNLNFAVVPPADPVCARAGSFGTFGLGFMPDADDDFFGDYFDNCPTVSNFNQNDSDGDGIGDLCDSDAGVGGAGGAAAAGGSH